MFINNAISVLCCEVLVYHFALNPCVTYSCFLMCYCVVGWGDECACMFSMVIIWCFVFASVDVCVCVLCAGMYAYLGLV